MLGKGVTIQRSILAMVLQHSGCKANGSPVPLLRGKINEVAGMVGKKRVA